MRNQKKKNRYQKKQSNVNKAEVSEVMDDQVNTTESVVTNADSTEGITRTSVANNASEEIVISDDSKIGADVSRVGIATLAVVILFGIIGYLALKTQVIDNWSERLLDWFNLV